MILLLSGCAAKKAPLVVQDDAMTRWARFLQRSESVSYDLLSCSLRFGPVNKTNRVTCLIWSGLPGGDSSPAAMQDLEGRVVRVDLSAGLGTMVGRILFSGDEMLLVVPQEKAAYFGAASRESLHRLLGVSLPLSIQQLNHFLAGGMAAALDVLRPEGYEKRDDGRVSYTCSLPDSDYCEVELDHDALPVRLSVPGKWTMDITYDDQGRPSRLSGRMHSVEGEQRLVLQVKERQPESSAPGLELKIPAGFTVTPLIR
ncbi:MAG: hypothetical protein IKJ34_06045 [Mailhella sp.]|nr:hypothetical protein [Mailhella sp.]